MPGSPLKSQCWGDCLLEWQLYCHPNKFCARFLSCSFLAKHYNPSFQSRFFRSDFMSSATIECVPNFSEGKDLSKIKRIAGRIESVPEIRLLDISPGCDAHRTVVTFLGPPEAVAEAAFWGIAEAAATIDMRKHRGVHPRIGATDVCPFVPIEGATLAECAAIAHRVGKRVGDELGIPVYFYEAASTSPERVNLADVRRGQYEGLPEKLKDPRWQPDCGPVVFNPRSGATIIGAREFLVAFNVTLNTPDKAAAADIACELRESGRKLGPNLRKPGMFKCVKAIGWYVEEYRRAQVSFNLTNFKVTPPHAVLEETRKLASERGLSVTGSELVGMIPYQALLEAGKFYLNRQGRSTEIPAMEILETAVHAMGLNDVQPFDIRAKVLGLPGQ
jgi:glutamate formiminotransferase / formiminotetrahydrofolate cyclodeaminase